jgi:hypothetical protein
LNIASISASFETSATIPELFGPSTATASSSVASRRRHNNTGALFHELLGDAQADPLPAAGDNGDLTSSELLILSPFDVNKLSPIDVNKDPIFQPHTASERWI